MKAKRVSSQIFIDKSKPLSRLTHPISPVKEVTDLLQSLKTPTQEWNCVKVNGPRETVCRLSKSPSYDLIWRGTQMETLQARQDDLSRLCRSLGRFAALRARPAKKLVRSTCSKFRQFVSRFLYWLFKIPLLAATNYLEEKRQITIKNVLLKNRI